MENLASPKVMRSPRHVDIEITARCNLHLGLKSLKLTGAFWEELQRLLAG